MQMGLVSWFGYKEKEIQSRHLVVRPFKFNGSNPVSIWLHETLSRSLPNCLSSLSGVRCGRVTAFISS